VWTGGLFAVLAGPAAALAQDLDPLKDRIDPVDPEDPVTEAPATDVEVDVRVDLDIALEDGIRTPAPTERSEPGTHFIAGIEAGLGVGGSVGFASAFTLGIGGKLVGFPLRFYLLGELGYVDAGSEGVIDGRGFREDRGYWDLMLGMRVYIPVFGPLRVFVDALGGTTLTTASLTYADMTPQHTSGWDLAAVVGVGLQVRVLHHFSVGGRLRVLFAGDPLSELRDQLTIGGPWPVSATAGLTWHF
jgi:hypothetical protein